MTAAALYMRVSTDDQTVENQRAEVEALCVARKWTPVWFIDQGLSGKTTARPQYQAMLEAARRGKVRAVVVWKLDRLGRKSRQIIEDIHNMDAWGCQFVSVRDPLFDTTSASGRFMLQLMGALAELDAAQTTERTLVAARTRRVQAASIGQQARWGRGRMASPEQVLQVWGCRDAGLSIRATAKETGLPKSTVEGVLTRPRPEPIQSADLGAGPVPPAGASA